MKALQSGVMCVFKTLAVLVAVLFNVGPSLSDKVPGEEKKFIDKVTRDSLDKFALKLFTAVAEKNTGNVLLSPVSLQVALALAYAGAGGETAEEIRKLLLLPTDLQDTLHGFKSLTELLHGTDVSLATRIFTSKIFQVKKEFQENAGTYFYAPAEALDFRADPEHCRLEINAWVTNQTRGKITDCLKQGSVTSNTSSVLVNAIHFLGKWKTAFNEKDTAILPFHVSQTTTVYIPMMRLFKTETFFRFSEDKELDAKILQMDYKNDTFCMVFILPNKLDGLKDLESKLKTVSLFRKLRQAYTIAKVNVFIPKFKLKTSNYLNGPLESLGVKSMFDDHQANFEKLTASRMYVDKVIQKAFIEVDEKGTEAAAATAIGMQFSPSAAEPFEDFKADHPFVFLITHVDYDVPLFLGRFVSP